MGPYCKFCETRCFKPVSKDDLVKDVDLKATCREGIIFDMSKHYKEIRNEHNGRVWGWLIELRKGEEYCLVSDFDQNVFEVKTTELTEHINGFKNSLHYTIKELP